MSVILLIVLKTDDSVLNELKKNSVRPLLVLTKKKKKLYNFKKLSYRSSCGSVETNPTVTPENAGSIPSLNQWVKDLALL